MLYNIILLPKLLLLISYLSLKAVIIDGNIDVIDIDRSDINNNINININKNIVPNIAFMTFSDRLREDECLGFRSIWVSGVEMMCLGIDGTFKNSDWAKKEFAKRNHKKWKPYAAREYINKLSENTLVIFSDASDVLYMPHLSKELLWQRYLEANPYPYNYIIFGAEAHCWPFYPWYRHIAKKVCSLFPKSNSTSPFQYLNSGNWMGFKNNALFLVEKWIENIESNPNLWDQYVAALLYKDQIVNITIDYEQLIFGADSNAYYKNGQLIMNNKTGVLTQTVTNTTPLILHFNGGKDQYKIVARTSYNYSMSGINQEDEIHKMKHMKNAMNNTIKLLHGNPLQKCQRFLKFY